jgi:hypothetical protein
MTIPEMTKINPVSPEVGVLGLDFKFAGGFSNDRQKSSKLLRPERLSA